MGRTSVRPIIILTQLRTICIHRNTYVMRMYLACESREILDFTLQGYRQHAAPFITVDSADRYGELLQHEADPKPLLLDVDSPMAPAILTMLQNAGETPPVPLVALVNTKHPVPEELPLPDHAIRLRKPFCIAGIEQAEKRAVRAAQGLPDEELQQGDVSLFPATGAAFRAGVPLRPHPREALLLEALMRAPGEVLERDFILQRFFDYTARLRPNLVDVLACRLRSRLHNGFDTPVLHTVRGKGYMFHP